MSINSRSVISIILLLCATKGTIPQTLTATDGDLNYLASGITYTLSYQSNPDSQINPLVTGNESGDPIKFSFSGSPGATIRIQFVLPTTLSGGCDESLPCSFSPDALYWEEKTTRLNPNIPQNLTTDSSGRITLDLGATVSIPPGITRDEFHNRVICFAQNTVKGDTLSSSAELTALMYWAGGFYYPPDGDLGNLSRGVTYTIVPGSVGNPITPIVNGMERGQIPKLKFDVPTGITIWIKWILPRGIVSDDGNGSLPCRFAPDAVLCEETGGRFDPNQSDTIDVGSHCSVTLEIGITATVPVNVALGSYTAQIIIEAGYVGTPPAGSEMELLYTAGVSSHDIPERFTLLQNYPNPFNSSTTISYGLADASNVTIRIFDILGRRVTSLLGGFQHAGWHSIEWEAADMPTGVYYYRLEAGNSVLVKKLSLVR